LNYPAEFFCHAQYKNGSAFIALMSVKQVIFGITLFVYLKKYSETLKLKKYSETLKSPLESFRRNT